MGRLLERGDHGWCVGGAPEIARPPGVQIGHLEARRQGQAAMRGASGSRYGRDSVIAWYASAAASNRAAGDNAAAVAP